MTVNRWLVIGVFVLGAQAVQAAGALRLSSPTLHEGGLVSKEHVLNGSGCGGQNISPALRWTAAPAATKSFGVTVFDVDAPGGRGFWHWVVFNLGPTSRELPAGAGAASGQNLPGGASQTRNDYGSPGYGGPCPPPGSTHRYVITVYALDVGKLGSSPSDAPARVAAEVERHALAKGSINVRYGR
jgi:Raf kinase inhibitor-like YbhB/YbcL family protein